VVNLAPSVVALPGGVPSPVTTFPTYDGDAAILFDNGYFDYQDLNVFGDPDQGVACASTVAFCRNQGGNISNSFFDNDDGNGLQTFAVDRGREQFDVTTTQSLATFTNEVNTARQALIDMRALPADQTINLGGSGTIGSDLTITLNDTGLNIIKFENFGGGDITVNSANLIIDAPGGATPGDRQAIIFLPDEANLLTSNGNIVVGPNMGLMDVVFVSLRQDNASHFNFSNTVLNGVAFWDMWRVVGASSDPSEHVWNNVTGCTQLLGDKINLSSEIHLSNCGFRGVSVNGDPTPMSEPGTLAILALGLAGLGFARRRQVA